MRVPHEWQFSFTQLVCQRDAMYVDVRVPPPDVPTVEGIIEGCRFSPGAPNVEIVEGVRGRIPYRDYRISFIATDTIFDASAGR